MSERDDREEPRTAAEEVLRAATEAERRTAGSAGHHRGPEKPPPRTGRPWSDQLRSLRRRGALAPSGYPGRMEHPLWNPGCPPRAGP
ncbi:hypothetical protein SHKM778_53120 [Streptomyces sp. KM77-8]|uniref:Uncharacterized protein n=1 Tax=Streptomyces haneummycinicus TaxID=3074435 RepID=A0AAT9HMY6_9ACTN